MRLFEVILIIRQPIKKERIRVMTGTSENTYKKKKIRNMRSESVRTKMNEKITNFGCRSGFKRKRYLLKNPPTYDIGTPSIIILIRNWADLQ